jgi:hypothetical protein
VTVAQRARLVVVLGILNLVLASLALAVGAFGIPSGLPRPSIDTAAGSPAPSTPAPAESTEPSAPPSAPPVTSEPPASPEPSATPAESAVPTPSAAPAASEPPLLARPITPNPTPRPEPTPRPAQPTPPPEPTPPPQPVSDAKLHPPCPDSVDGPPGQAKAEGRDQPCGKGRGNSDRDSGIVIVLPLAAIATWVASHGRRPSRPRRPSRRG